MSVVKGFVLATSLALSISAVVSTSTSSAVAAPNKEALKAMLEKCSREADAKGLNVKVAGKVDPKKVEERKAFRNECMKKMGVEKK